MSINGREAVSLLASMEKRVALHRKDNTDKLWSYKLLSRPGTEFAFDPNTTTGLFVWVDRAPIGVPGVQHVERMTGKSSSTALDRVFTGGLHRAVFKAKIDSQEALVAFIECFEGVGVEIAGRPQKGG